MRDTRLRLSGELARRLWKHRKQTQARDAELVFPSSTGSWLHAGHLADKVFRPAAAAAGIPWLGFHGFRHTCATALFRESANVKQVQAWLGHHSPAFTLETYVHLLPEDLPDPPSLAVAALEMRAECEPNPPKPAETRLRRIRRFAGSSQVCRTVPKPSGKNWTSRTR